MQKIVYPSCVFQSDSGYKDFIGLAFINPKYFQVFAQWSIAGAAVKECSSDLQSSIIQRWLDSKLENGKGSQYIVYDIEVLMKSANQTSFLYKIAILLWRKVFIHI